MPWPTNLYPKVLYSTSCALEARHPATAAQPQYTELTASNVSASGKRETIVLRREETRQIAFPVEGGLQIEEWGSFVRDWGARGRQFELLLDRHTGALLTLANSVEDIANKNTVAYTGTASFSNWSGKPALRTSSGYLVSVSASAGCIARPVVGSGGAVVVTFIPMSGANVGSGAADMTLCEVTSGANANRLWLVKQGSCAVRFSVWTAGGSCTTVTWEAASWTLGSDVVTVIGLFTATGSAALWYGKNGALSQASNYAESNAGSFVSMPASVAFCAKADKTNHAPVHLLHAGLYRWPYDDPTILASYFPVGRNYYDKAELADQAFSPARTAPSVDQWAVALNVRQGF